MRGRNKHTGVIGVEDRLRARLMGLARITVEKQYRGCLNPESLQHRSERLDLFCIQRGLYRGVGQDALVDLKAQRALDQRLVLLEEQVVRIRTIDASDLVDIAEPLRDQKGGPRAGALQDGVDGNGRAMEKQARGFVIAA